MFGVWERTGGRLGQITKVVADEFVEVVVVVIAVVNYLDADCFLLVLVKVGVLGELLTLQDTACSQIFTHIFTCT